jgi:hypothetical protein
LPPELEYLWEYYRQLAITRRNYGWGGTGITYAEIDAWGRLYNVSLDPWELEAILKVDSVYLAVAAEVEAKRKQQQGNT